MPYARTVLEVALAQALIVAGFFLSPFDIVDRMGPVPSGMMVAAVTLGAAQVIYNRHRKRISDQVFVRKLHVLRSTTD